MTTQTAVPRDTMRTLRVSDLRAVATADPRQLIHGRVPTAEEREEAASQLQLRLAGAAKVRGALASIGHRPSGTEWEIAAFTLPVSDAAEGEEQEIGFVNLAKGIAVASGVYLSADETEALTVPEQEDGPIVSGAASWTSPDAGEGHRASSPRGWTQLVLDLRTKHGYGCPVLGHGADLPGIDEAVAAMPRPIACGLATCYSKPDRVDRGLPHNQIQPPISGPHWGRLNPQEWPFNVEQRERVATAVGDWMSLANRAVASQLDDPEPVLALFAGGATSEEIYGLTSEYPVGTEEFGPTVASHKEQRRGIAAREAARQYAADSWIDWAYESVDRASLPDTHPDRLDPPMRSIDVFRGLLTRVVYQRLAAVADAVEWILAGDPILGPTTDAQKQFRAVIDAAAASIASAVCRDFGDDAPEQPLSAGHPSVLRLLDSTLRSILYEDGPAYFGPSED